MSGTAGERPVYEAAITTFRTAEEIARAYGYENLAQLAARLPQRGSVFDLGAGDSPFGAAIATLRPDITWTNLDLSYGRDPEMVEQLRASAPD